MENVTSEQFQDLVKEVSEIKDVVNTLQAEDNQRKGAGKVILIVLGIVQAVGLFLLGVGVYEIRGVGKILVDHGTSIALAQDDIDTLDPKKKRFGLEEFELHIKAREADQMKAVRSMRDDAVALLLTEIRRLDNEIEGLPPAETRQQLENLEDKDDMIDSMTQSNSRRIESLERLAHLEPPK